MRIDEVKGPEVMASPSATVAEADASHEAPIDEAHPEEGRSGREGDRPELTQEQIQARIRMKQRVEELRLRKEAEVRLQEQELREQERQKAEDEGIRSKLVSRWTQSADDDDLPEVVYSPDEAPDGPPWRYDLTPEQRAAKELKKARRGEKRQRIKDKALDKTPERLKGPSDLQVRFRTALVYTITTIACVMVDDITTLLYLMLVAGICAGEFYYMLRSDAKLPNEALGITGAVLYLPAIYLWGAVGAVCVATALLIALAIWYVFWLKARIQDVSISFFGAAYTGLLLSGLMVIRQSIEGPWAGLVVFLIFLSVWANDAFAYFFGSRFGKHKLAPRTSPKKSWEGFFAGLVGSVIVWVIISFVPGVRMEIWVAVVIGIVCGVFEIIGDLIESRIKRNLGFKDSGTIMPGHGGLLDRCDSLFLASPVACALMIAFGCITYAGI